MIKNMRKQEKVFFVENLAEELKAAKSVVLINYAGLTVKNQQELKKRLKEAGAKMVVVKNTLLKRAAENAKLDKQVLADEILTGQTALVIANNDPIAPLQVLGKFAKEYEVLKFKVGIIDSAFQNEEALNKISTLPGRDALLGQLLASLTGNLSDLVRILQNPMQELIYTVNSKLT
jgi:large subunit ribosomal protein L10